jgi:nucleotide-binding universal stress UspA family protein
MAARVNETVDFDGGIVVGVDGSESSIHALHLAAAEATCRNAVLHVLCAWSVRAVPRPADCPPGQVPSLLEYEQEVRRRITERVAKELGEQTPLTIEIHPVHAPPNHALIEASKRADLLVVGHRGRGSLRDRMLGTVAEVCVRQARCPVLVARPAEPAETGPDREEVGLAAGQSDEHPG